ncbi:MAG: tetratricopeptide repeat protein [Gemmatimonadota bacterium]|nr:tetratricopeptide repeat protein [Gemmatimonadota bacterium]MDH3427018.1 tetratricopeptide repeat protein [Gemmatimonadota bacterium]
MRFSALIPLTVMAVVVACDAGQDGAAERGDRLLASGSVDEAIAEYKLALRQNGEDADVLIRLGITYAKRGEVEAALQYFRRTLEQDSTYWDAVAVELTEAARVAKDQGSPDNMARALEMAQRMGAEFLPLDLKLELAAYYVEVSDYGRALPLYLSALESGETGPETWLAAARAFQESGGCREGLAYFKRYLESPAARRADGSAARWQYGQCLFEVAEQDRLAGRSSPALQNLDLLIRQGVPRTLLDRAHFARGEILRRIGNLAAAQGEYQMVLDLNPALTGPLVRVAQERIREIRYGEPEKP